MLIKVIDEPHPPDDTPRILAAICVKDEHGRHNPAEFRFTEIGKGSTCVQSGLQEYTRAVPWKAFFHGFTKPLQQNVVEANCMLDLYYIREEVQCGYRVRVICCSASSYCIAASVMW